ncbi:uncharacterized protein DNG_09772 [Cephalotrichum gorgonifer]|uniref:Xylanolytic transcriptional activator regulatory domain-containing protein n=1 Tax=Cephalotrichum gorgonifer TaxID=2041049 RepID=A0AAE8SZR2_9PEZI|nr:uncharacterized protein DNG_09772 [Cephalotrichum gorgonifer]
MGPAAEQDNHLLDAFRSVILSENDQIDADIIQVFPGNPQLEQPPVHFLMLENEFPQHTNLALQTASTAIESTVRPHGESLVRLYFKFVHPAYPIVSKNRFLRQYATSREAIPASLRGAVYALASSFWQRDSSLAESPCPYKQHELVNLAHDSLRRELEAPNMFKLQASLLLLHIRPPEIDSVETPSTWVMASQATACAQMMGLHRDATRWNIPLWEKRERRKLWWAVYLTDCWSAACHGNPPHISAGSFDTEFLTMDDLRHGEDVPEDLCHLVDAGGDSFRIADGARFLEMVKLSQDWRAVMDCSFNIGLNESTRPCASHRREILSVWERFQSWPSLLPQCLAARRGSLPRNADSNAYYAGQALLFRTLMSPATREAKAIPQSNLRQWFPRALSEFRAFTDFVANMTKEDLECFWIRHARSHLILCGNFLIYLFLLASAPSDVEAAYGLLESFHQSLQRLRETESEDGRLLLRPVMLRIDSFFTQAAGVIRRSHNVNSSDISQA